MFSQDVERLTDGLNNLVGPGNWHVDLPDCDKVLRIQAARDVSAELKVFLERNAFHCEPLL